MDLSEVWFLILAVFAIGGAIKGTLGFGMPLTTMSLLSAFLDVPVAAALNAFPILIANLFQATRGGLLRQTVRRFWVLLLALAIGTWLGAMLILLLDPKWLLGALGAITILFCAVNHFRTELTVPQRFERLVGAFVGFVAGVIGGMSTVHGPPLIMYTASLRLAREAFVAALGTFFMLGGVFVTIAYIERGVVNMHTAPWSLACVPPVLAGMWLGQWLSRHINQDLFRKLVLLALLVLGVNLLRRALL